MLGKSMLRNVAYIFKGRKRRICWYCLLFIIVLFFWLCFGFVLYGILLLFRSIINSYPQSDRESIINALPPPLQPILVPPELINQRDLEPRTEEEKDEHKKGMDRYGFNKFKIDRLPWFRPLNDIRDDLCKASMPSIINLPSVSIVIIFVNEAFSVLMRSITSVISTTPISLLNEIILVDDASDDPIGDLNNLENTIENQFQKVKLVRHQTRKGLVQARLTGAKIASGDVIVFLDSHIECIVGWLEPLLVRIQINSKRVVCPVIDVISWETLEMTSVKGPINIQGTFSWTMEFRWRGINEQDRHNRKSEIDPIRSQAMAGGLFAIDRKYFFEIGAYDPDMNIWGGENLEISFRIWMCGGELEIIPCSHVAHVFRERHASYTFPGGSNVVITRNIRRLVEVWLDDYKEEYYKRRPDSRNVDLGDISERVKLRNDLNCHSFEWYLTEIAPDIPVAGKNVIAEGPVSNSATSKCMDTEHRHSGDIKMITCYDNSPSQFIIYTSRNELQFDEDYCLDVSVYSPRSKVNIYNCHGLGGNQLFALDKITNTIKHTHSSMCLATELGIDILIIANCDTKSPSQIWNFKRYYDI